MSFRWFIYYSSLLGGCAAYLGWIIGRFPVMRNHVGQAAVKGLFLGLLLAVVLTLVDILWNLSGQKIPTILFRIAVAAFVGAFGGLLGGMLGQALYSQTQWTLFLLLGWTLTGLLIGTAPGLFELLVALAKNENNIGAARKVTNGVLGGALGGIVGGALFLLTNGLWQAILGDQIDELWSPSATGFVALGLCIGLLVGLAQVILKVAWIKVEQGFRSGRELILTKGQTTIGRAEGCEIALFGDSEIEKEHARILLEGDRYFVEDLDTTSGTYINGKRIRQRARLHNGDEISFGRAVLRFGERQRRAEDEEEEKT